MILICVLTSDSSAERYSQSERCFSSCRAECWCGRCSGLFWCSQSYSSPSSSWCLYWSVCLFTRSPNSIIALFSRPVKSMRKNVLHSLVLKKCPVQASLPLQNLKNAKVVKESKMYIFFLNTWLLFQHTSLSHVSVISSVIGFSQVLKHSFLIVVVIIINLNIMIIIAAINTTTITIPLQSSLSLAL